MLIWNDILKLLQCNQWPTLVALAFQLALKMTDNIRVFYPLSNYSYQDFLSNTIIELDLKTATV